MRQNIKRRSARLCWLVFDRSVKASTMQIEIQFNPSKRKFEGSFRKRSTKFQSWPLWREATPEQIGIAKRLLTPGEIAECTAASINRTSAEPPSRLTGFEFS